MPIPTFPGAYVIRASGDPIIFDVTEQITHTLKNDITEHPVEQGANVTDHVRALLDELVIDVFVSNAPITGQDRFAFDLDVGAPASLDTVPATVLQFYQATDFAAETYRVLRQIRDAAELVQVITKEWDYKDLCIKEVSAPKTAAEGDGLKFTITFKQIRLVATKQVPSPVPTEPRAKPAVDKGAKGAKETTPQEPKKSILKTGLDAVKGFFK